MSETTAGLEPQYPPPTVYERIEARPRPTLPQLSYLQMLWLVVAAIATNLAMRTGLGTASTFVAVAIVVGPILGQTFKRSRNSAVFAGAAVAFSAWLPLRASTWLTSLNTAALVAALIAAACTLHPIALRLDMRTIKTVLSRFILFRYVGSLIAAASRPLRSLPGGRLLPLFRGVLIAAIPVGVLAMLLASADAVFAQSFAVGINPGSAFSHLFLTAFAFLAICGLVAISSEPPEESFHNNKPLGATEALVLLVSIAGLYAAFAVVQVMGAAGALRTILDQQGLTYAEYARSGFFQLLWVAGLTIVLLGTVRLLVIDKPGTLDTVVRVTGAFVSLLTILIVAVAISRLGLYTDAFGQTTLRWYCTAFAWMLGPLFVVLAVAHHRRAEQFLPAVALGVLAVTLLSVNILNPEARVAHHNLTRSDAAVGLDADYLVRLSADAWPEILDQQDLVSSRLSPGRLGVGEFDRRCKQATNQAGYGPFGFNLAKATVTCPVFDS